MFFIKKYRHRPVYKKLTTLNENVQNKQKLFKFKKLKWKRLLFKLKQRSKYKKRNSYYKFYDPNCYYVSKFSNYFSRNYKSNVINKKSFNLYYGGLNKKYLKCCLKKSIHKSNKINNSINLKNFFNSYMELRLDTVLFRSNFVLSIANSRQLIKHGHIHVNEKIVKESSFLLQAGDKVTIDKKVHNLIQYYILKSKSWPIPSNSLQISYKNLHIRIIEDYIVNSVNNKSSTLNSVIDSYKVK